MYICWNVFFFSWKKIIIISKYSEFFFLKKKFWVFAYNYLICLSFWIYSDSHSWQCNVPVIRSIWKCMSHITLLVLSFEWNIHELAQSVYCIYRIESNTAVRKCHFTELAKRELVNEMLRNGFYWWRICCCYSLRQTTNFCYWKFAPHVHSI